MRLSARYTVDLTGLVSTTELETGPSVAIRKTAGARDSGWFGEPGLEGASVEQRMPRPARSAFAAGGSQFWRSRRTLRIIAGPR
jgi:hypothetical protein